MVKGLEVPHWRSLFMVRERQNLFHAINSQKVDYDVKDYWHKKKPKCLNGQKFCAYGKEYNVQIFEEASTTQVVIKEDLF